MKLNLSYINSIIQFLMSKKKKKRKNTIVSLDAQLHSLHSYSYNAYSKYGVIWEMIETLVRSETFPRAFVFRTKYGGVPYRHMDIRTISLNSYNNKKVDLS